MDSSESASFYDFDLTVRWKHSFQEHRIEQYENTQKNKYESGMQEAQIYIKKSFSQQFKHDDHAHLSAIVTYHNNPDFIAGHVHVLLGKALTLKETFFSEEPVTAINLYSVEGLAKPFLISYLPEKGEKFQERMQELTGKNEQILFLKKILQERGYLPEDAIINFYDDSAENCSKAMALEGVRSYLVDGNSTEFRIVGSTLSQATRHSHSRTFFASDEPSTSSGLPEGGARGRRKFGQGFSGLNYFA